MHDTDALTERLDDVIGRHQDEIRRSVRREWAKYGDPGKQLGWETIDAYVELSRDALARETRCLAGQDDDAIVALVRETIVILIDEDEAEIARIVSETNWELMTKSVVALSTRRHGNRVDRFGKSVEDYVTDAVVLLLERRRHFPWRRVKLMTFLVRTVDNLVYLARCRALREGPRLSISNDTIESPFADEISEERLPGQHATCEDELIRSEMIEALMASFDRELAGYARLHLSGGLLSAADLAETLGVTVKHVRNLQRRLRRTLARTGGLAARQMLPAITLRRPGVLN